MEHKNYYIYYIFITGLSLLFCIIFYRTIFYIISLNQMASRTYVYIFRAVSTYFIDSL